MGFEVTTLLKSMQIILQAGCAYYAFSAFTDSSVNGHRPFWLAIGVGFALMTVRRITAFLIGLGVKVPNLGTFDRLWIPFTITILLFIGMRGLHRYIKCKKAELTESRGEIENLHKKLDRITEEL